MCAILSAALAVASGAAQGQPAQTANPPAWFGVPAPGPVSDLDKPTFEVAADAYGPEPFRPARPLPPQLAGDKLMADVATIVGFSRERKAAGDPLWGRISGLEGEKRAVDWAVGRMKAAGVANAHAESYPVERPVWIPKAWSVRLSGDASFGAGTRDVTLQSAYPQPSGKSLAAPVTAPLVFVGRGSPAELANIDVRGKIAVVNVVPDLSLFASREKGVAREAVARGAVGVINAVESPGNLLFYDSRYGCGEAPCFMVGGDDGAFLEAVIGRAAKAGKQVTATLSLASETRTGLTAYNGVAVIEGKSKETVIVDAHADAWFDGANDNADGLAVMVGLAEYFAKRGKPDRTLLFLVSGGHHTGNGPAAFIAAHPEVMANTVMIMNLEHLAQIAVAQAARTDPGLPAGYDSLWDASTTETSKSVGVINSTQYVRDLLARASRTYGVVTSFNASASVPGDLGAFARLGKPAFQLISSEVYYHSSGDTPSTISKPGLERVAAFFADVIDQIARARRDQLVGPGAK